MQKIEIFSYKDKQSIDSETVVESGSLYCLMLKNVKGNLLKSKQFFDSNTFAIAWNGYLYLNCKRRKNGPNSKDLIFSFSKKIKGGPECL